MNTRRLSVASWIYKLAFALAVLALIAVAMSGAPFFLFAIAAIVDEGRWQAVVALLIWFLIMVAQFGLIRSALKCADADQRSAAIVRLGLALSVVVPVFLTIIA